MPTLRVIGDNGDDGSELSEPESSRKENESAASRPVNEVRLQTAGKGAQTNVGFTIMCLIYSQQHLEDKQKATTVISDISNWSCHNQSRRADALAIHLVIKTLLFPLLKFINKTCDMEFTLDVKKICGFMLKHCNIQLKVPAGVSEAEFEEQQLNHKREWWSENKKGVSKQHCDYRNNRIKAIEALFKGESFNRFY